MFAIEVDGPHHFTVNTHDPLGETLARRKQLEARGWTVISIPFFDWNNKTRDSRLEYLHTVRSLPCFAKRQCKGPRDNVNGQGGGMADPMIMVEKCKKTQILYKVC